MTARNCRLTTRSVSPASRSARVSPMHTMGERSPARAAPTFSATLPSVSPKSCLRSLCPTRTQPHPASFSIGTLTSPVKAPDALACMFCAASKTPLPSISWAIAASTVNGGAMRMSTRGSSLLIFTHSAASVIPAGPPLYIFQLPAMSGLRFSFTLTSFLDSALRSVSTNLSRLIHPPASAPENLDTRELLPFDELQGSSAPCRDVAHFAREPAARCVNGGSAIAPSDDGEGAGFDHRARDAKRTVRERCALEKTHRTVPEDGLRP